MAQAQVKENVGGVKPFNPGHRACPGCGLSLAARLVMEAAGTDVIVACATGCLEVFSTPHPESAWGVPWIHSLFENPSAVAAGIEVGLKAQGKTGSTKLLAMGGDGATIDIGFGCLSGMLERGHNVLYVCYDNEAYMNTGIQRSGSTPFGAMTTTSPAGKVSYGEDRPKKDAPAIFAAHGIPYSATTSVGYWPDLRRKVKKALEIEGPKYLQIHCPCPPGWGQSTDTNTIALGRLAVETGLYPIVEYEDGIISKVRKIKHRPVEDYLKLQRRFAHLFKAPNGAEVIAKIQALADANIKKFGLVDEESA